MLGPGPRFIKKKRIYRAAVSQSLRNTDMDYIVCLLHVSATLMDILSEVHFKRYIIKRFEAIHKRKVR